MLAGCGAATRKSRWMQHLATTALLCSSSSPSSSLRRSGSSSFAMAFSTSDDGSNTSDQTTLLLQALGRTDQDDPAVLPTHPYMKVHHIKTPIGSTQDEARRLLRGRTASTNNNNSTASSFFAVVADQQTAGRGTSGRTWESSSGNLYLTVALPLASIPVTLTLLPLQIAVLVASRAEQILKAVGSHEGSDAASSAAKVRVKWPNDVLVDGAKLSGTLIESETIDAASWFLIGIGINVQEAPSLAQSPGKHGRATVSLQDYCPTTRLPPTTALYLGIDLAYALADWVTDKTVTRDEANTIVLQAWKARVDWGESYEIRSDDIREEEASTHVGERVVSIALVDDGQLRVRGADGKERLLVADYFF
jgi:BirA family biotin operon repressor/biotin-[acetyl-CoA-carboxylase] ligase